ncbi:MAG TPA: tRNA (adenosine(37)-N6)-threonylcarbamoyltransferase complex dimerization subunit type 1 TsaB [Acetobacteraceae bacterium]|nr:tRNA (adenosine(37)-N6)-threonylcarbamoyltransferase complex dimerization subunit type 1 TsaB [Acetobacteraceae bacterium]
MRRASSSERLATVLTLDAALGRVSAGVVVRGAVITELAEPAAHGQPARLAAMVRELLAGGAWSGAERIIAVTLGPGSFTGIRAALALAHGVALAGAAEIVGVSVGDALRAGRAETALVAVDSRRGHVHLDIGGEIKAIRDDALPGLTGPVEVVGDAAERVATAWRARGIAVRAVEAVPEPLGIAIAAEAQRSGALPRRPLVPIYVDPPAVRLSLRRPRPSPTA